VTMRKPPRSITVVAPPSTVIAHYCQGIDIV
jgi:hypothetical protein